MKSVVMRQVGYTRASGHLLAQEHPPSHLRSWVGVLLRNFPLKRGGLPVLDVGAEEVVYSGSSGSGWGQDQGLP